MTYSFRNHSRPRSDLASTILAILVGIAVNAGNIAQAGPRERPVAASESQKAEAPLRGRRTATDIIYGDWRKICFKPAGTKTLCRTSITGKFGTGQVAVRIDVIERDDGRTRLQLFLPVGMYLPAGVKLSVNEGGFYPVPYTWCLSNGCIAADVAPPRLIEQMESGQTLRLELVDTNILSLTTSVPLAQFASVHKGSPEKTFEQDIEE